MLCPVSFPFSFFSISFSTQLNYKLAIRNVCFATQFIVMSYAYTIHNGRSILDTMPVLFSLLIFLYLCFSIFFSFISYSCGLCELLLSRFHGSGISVNQKCWLQNEKRVLLLFFLFVYRSFSFTLSFILHFICIRSNSSWLQFFFFKA